MPHLSGMKQKTANIDIRVEPLPQLVERIDAWHTRRSTVRTGDLVVDLKTRIVSVHDKLVRMTGTEYSIVELLSLRKGTTVTKKMLVAHLYGGLEEPELKIIDVFVCRLRKKLAQATGGKHHIETVWGRGYRMRDPDQMSQPPTRERQSVRQ